MQATHEAYGYRTFHFVQDICICTRAPAKATSEGRSSCLLFLKLLRISLIVHPYLSPDSVARSHVGILHGIFHANVEARGRLV